MKIAIVIIGDEILLGRVTDTNSGAIARTFDPEGFEIVGVTTVGDNPADITNAVRNAMTAADLVFTTGGLGPTKDDMTKHVLRDIFGGEFVRDDSVTENIKRVFSAKGLKLNQLTLDQALVPDSCRVIQNAYGTAPVMWFERDGKVLITLPGVPGETTRLLKGIVRDEVRRHFTPRTAYVHETFIVTGISESALAERLDTFEEELKDGFHLAYLPDSPIIRLRLDASGEDKEYLTAEMSRQSEKLIGLLGELMIHRGDASVAEIAIDMAREKGLTIGCAESCTGGKIAAMFTSVAGCSDTFMGGVVSYSNDVKANVLNVSQNDLDAHGAVSQPVVEQMTKGACARLGVDCAVATSGIAGPGGGTPEKPVGTVWIGMTTPAGTVSALHHFNGDREAITRRAATTAIVTLIKQLKNL
jgi:nicotinamide-nucleotide amidase